MLINKRFKAMCGDRRREKMIIVAMTSAMPKAGAFRCAVFFLN